MYRKVTHMQKNDVTFSSLIIGKNASTKTFFQLKCIITVYLFVHLPFCIFLHWYLTTSLLETPKCSWHNVIIWQLTFCRYSLHQIVSMKLCKKWENLLNDKFSTGLEMAYCLFSKLISMEFSSSFLRLHLPWT